MHAMSLTPFPVFPLPRLLVCRFARDRPLPRAYVGDLFIIHDTGAHAHGMGFQYNGKLRAPELLLRAGDAAPRRVDVVRERETIHCLFDNTRMPADLDGEAAPFPYAGRGPAPLGASGTPSMTSNEQQGRRE